MGNLGFYQDWLVSALFWLGACISVFGCYLLAFPGNAIKTGKRMNHWVSTDSFFSKLDRPHFQERLFYRWHRPFGILVVASSVYILYMFLFQVDVNSMASAVPLSSQREANLWLYETMVYFFIITGTFTLVFGLIIIVRPSVLKKAERRLNTWIGTEKSLGKLDHSYHIPEKILPGNVRIFGAFVFVSGVYMMYMLG